VVLKLAAVAYAELLRPLTYCHIAGLPYAALPLATATALHTMQSLVYPRKESKAYGTSAEVEGVYAKGDTAVMLDDLATTGGSKIEALAKLHAAGLLVTDVVVLVDRQSGARDELHAHGLHLHALYTIDELMQFYADAHCITAAEVANVQRFLRSQAVQPASSLGT
jgi:uridine monophosphate synthetase